MSDASNDPSSLVLKFIGVVTRAAILSFGVTLINRGLSNQVIVTDFADATSELVVGVSTAVFSVAWSFVQKYVDHAKINDLQDEARRVIWNSGK